MRRLFLLLALFARLSSGESLPNILWLTAEDHGPHMGCYGDDFATTPNVDALAARGMLFKTCWSNAPVCAAARTTLIAGIYGPSSGGQHMRSMVPMPEGKKMYPQFLREAGYYCTNCSKEDYNLVKPEGVWDESSPRAHWKNRGDGQPFFAIFNFTASHESKIRKRPHTAIHDPAKVRVPRHHPDTPEVRQDWAQYYDIVSEVDALAGARLAEVERAGLTDDTIIFYYADHGSGMPRHKRWPANSGLAVPMVVYFPPKWQHLAPKEYAPGVKSDRLVSFVDLAPTLLSMVGIQPPDWMQGHAFAGSFQTEPPAFLHGFRGRMDERIDCVRSVTDGRYVYLRNYMPHLSQGQHVNYQFETPTTRVWRALFDEGTLSSEQAAFWETPKAPEELYDLQADPDEVVNLASSPEHAAALQRLRAEQRRHALEVRDVGLLAEGEMHRRSAGRSPYDMARAPGEYPLERVLETAEMASEMKAEANSELLTRLKDSDPAIRYWAAMGFRMRDAAAVAEAHSALMAALKDEQAEVRIAAAWALALHGAEADRPAALETLLAAADWSQSTVFSAIAALNAIDDLGEKAAPILDQVKQLPTKGPSPDGRYNGYVGNLIRYLSGEVP
ncbi:MAG: sulfatase-like hydrolase/transferase [Verrucomicrobiales bacterium]|nr:sulfatase-like hydrolase/transferase [Verrucomicrobiales bacterium]